MSPSAWMDLIYVAALVVPFIVFGGICRFFWKTRHDD